MFARSGPQITKPDHMRGAVDHNALIFQTLLTNRLCRAAELLVLSPYRHNLAFQAEDCTA